MKSNAARDADGWLLKTRLREHGLRGFREVEVHENSTVMVSIGSRRVLRVHRGYAYASDEVIRAIVEFVTPGVDRRRASRAKHAVLSFPVDRFVAAPNARRRRTRRNRPEDSDLVKRLTKLHREFNELHFDGALQSVPIRVSSRMRRRLGEVLLEDAGCGVKEIALSRRHIQRDGWNEVAVTLLHEMVHQWQAERGASVDHGIEFKRMARRVGIPPTASREV